MFSLVFFDVFEKQIPNTNITQQNKLQNEIKQLNDHVKWVIQQREAYERDINELDKHSIMIQIDFKQNIIVGRRNNEINGDFYRYKQNSIFGIVIFIQNHNPIYVDYISKCTNKTSRFAIECISKCLQLQYFNNKKKFILWCDVGNHFRSKEMIYFVLHDIYKKIPTLESTSINYFVECHGKGLVDGHFAKLTMYIKQGLLRRGMMDTKDAIDLINEEHEIANQINKQQNREETILHIIEYHPLRRQYTRRNYLEMKYIRSSYCYQSICNSNYFYNCMFSNSSTCIKIKKVKKINTTKLICKYEYTKEESSESNIINSYNNLLLLKSKVEEQNKIQLSDIHSTT